jgi:hypothetical protein
MSKVSSTSSASWWRVAEARSHDPNDPDPLP